MPKILYLYEDCKGDLYFTDEYVEPEFCNYCKEYHIFIGFIGNAEQIINYMTANGYSDWYIDEILEEYEMLRTEEEVEYRWD